VTYLNRNDVCARGKCAEKRESRGIAATARVFQVLEVCHSFEHTLPWSFDGRLHRANRNYLISVPVGAQCWAIMQQRKTVSHFFPAQCRWWSHPRALGFLCRAPFRNSRGRSTRDAALGVCAATV